METEQVEGLHCLECNQSTVYYAQAHHLDGNRQNNAPSNLVLVCPDCHKHFVFRFSPADIFILKMRGLNNAEIGRVLGISRERVRQIWKRTMAEVSQWSEDKASGFLGLALHRQEQLIITEWDLEEEELKREEEELEGQRERLSEEELRIWKKNLADKRRRHNTGKSSRVSKKRMTRILTSMIDNPKRR